MKFNIFKDVVQIPNDKGVNENYNVLVVHDENNQVLAHSKATKESVVFLEYDGLFYLCDDNNKIWVSWDSIVNKFKD